MQEKLDSKYITESYTSQVRVDREKGLIHDVLLMGEKSENGMIYPNIVREKAKSLFEGVFAYIDHEQDTDKKYGKSYNRIPRKGIQNKVGKFFNIRNTDEGIRGDFKVLKSHPFGPAILEAAEDMPDAFCCSPTMGANWDPSQRDQDNNTICSEIVHVKSVDIVTYGATTKSLFEEQLAQEGEEEPDAAEHYAAACLKYAVEVVTKALDGELTPEEAAAEIKTHLKNHLKLYKKEEPASETEGETTEESTAQEELRQLKLEKECRLLIEHAHLDSSNELISLLQDLPSKEAREKHLTFLKCNSLVKQQGKKVIVNNGVHSKNDLDDMSFLRS